MLVCVHRWFPGQMRSSSININSGDDDPDDVSALLCEREHDM